MSDNPNHEKTATEERVDQYADGAVILPATRDANESEPGGLPPGAEDKTTSPVAPK